MRSETLPGYVDAEPAQLDLCFERAASGKTWLSRQRGGYPFHVGRVLPLTRRIASSSCRSHANAEVIVQSSSGGLFENDRVFQRFVAMPRARATVRTAAATIVHTMTHGIAHSRVAIEAHPESRFDYLPQPTILFPAACLLSTIDVVLHRAATVLIADTWLTHDPTHRVARQQLRVGVADVEGCIQHTEARGSLTGVRQTYGAHGGLLVLRLDDGDAGNEALTRAINAALQKLDTPPTTAYAAAGVLPGACGTFVRMLAADSIALRAIFSTAVEAVHLTLDSFHEGAPRASHASQNRY
jgi:urease accessory protein